MNIPRISPNPPSVNSWLIRGIVTTSLEYPQGIFGAGYIHGIFQIYSRYISGIFELDIINQSL